MRAMANAPDENMGASKRLISAPGVLAGDGLGPGRVIELQRARILAAMVQTSVQYGASNVTVAHVVERAGVSRRTFYEIFTDRDDCFIAAFDDALARASRTVLDAYDPQASWVERVRSALIRLLELLDAERDTGWLLIVGSLGAGTLALERRRRILVQIVSVIDEGRTQAKNATGLRPVTAEAITGGVLSVLHSRLSASSPPATPRVPGTDAPQPAHEGDPLLELTGPLMSMIVLPYLGASAARRELARPTPTPNSHEHTPIANANPLMQLEMRLTYRTVRVLMAIAANPGSSNRALAEASDITDQGQTSKLLTRLHHLELIINTGAGPTRGEPNAWTLTDKGWRVQNAIAEQTTGGDRL
jgi:AcrR family transcriptional regulator/DNA-binding MarR family transcriptional regulator